MYIVVYDYPIRIINVFIFWWMMMINVIFIIIDKTISTRMSSSTYILNCAFIFYILNLKLMRLYIVYTISYHADINI